MGFRFRKSIRIAPGIRLNLGRRGVGLSAGVRGLRYSVSSSGRRTRTISVPGTGISHVSTTSASHGTQAVPADGAPPAQSWVRRHKVLTGLGAVLVIGLIGSAFDDSPKDTKPVAAAVSPTPEVAASPEAEPSVKPITKSVAKPTPKPVVRRTSSPSPKPVLKKVVTAPKTDPRFDTCREANDAGYGPYVEGQDPEYDWYRDRDHDGVVCEP